MSTKHKLKFIKGFGFELEGGWETPRYAKMQTERIQREGGRIDTLIKGDGSVQVDETQAGEIASPVFHRLEKAWKFIKDYYPDETNRTCGFHIHISLDERYYVMLMEKDFYDKFIIWAEKIGRKFSKRLPATFMERVHGANTFCLNKFIPNEQVKGNADRYTQLNYCYNDHKTLENRMFPGCKNAQTAFFLLTQYLCFVENYLKNTKLTTVKHNFDVVCDIIEIQNKKIGEEICA